MTQSDSPYSFRTATVDDLPMLSEWQRRPHVAAWWDASTEYTPDDLLDRRMAIWIVGFDDRPFAFLQDYDVHGWPDHPFGYLPPGSRGIDQFIADPAMLGIGHGSAFIRLHVLDLLGQGVPVVGTDPDPRNGRAIAAYGKVGFTVVAGPVETEWGPSLLMECRA